jgi:hypothetical protein
LRKIAWPPLLPSLSDETAQRSAICLPCHTPDPSRASAPFASAAALWLGRGGLDPTTGASLEGPAPLAGLDGGCLHCHKGDGESCGEPASFARRVPSREGMGTLPGFPSTTVGGNHTFAARWQDCVECPKEDPKRPGGIQQRARQLYLDARLFRVLGDVRPLHASTAEIRRNIPARRALWNLLLLLEDKAAEVHNPPYAKTLLESAESILRSRAAAREPGRSQR